jgi:hypothetical protein
MTAEVVVMNREAIALAADSAVTVTAGGNQKVFVTNKIFGLSTHRPVGVMIFSAANVMSAPWEPIVKAFRAELGSKGFGTVERYAKTFLRYVEKHAV